MVFFKQLFLSALFPFPLCLELMLLGMILLWFTKRKKIAHLFLSAGFIFLAVLSWTWLPDWFLKPLEYRYPPLLDLKNLSQVRWVVVLGGGHTSDPHLPPNSQLTSASLSRLIEGLRIHRSLAGSKIILSGMGVLDPVPEAVTMAKVALALGVDKESIVLESDSKDTEGEAEILRKLVGDGPFILVTSAAHMPRSVALFRKLGMSPIPAPTDYKIKQRQREGPISNALFPSMVGISKTETSLYEYLGLTWAKIRGKA